MSYSGTWKRLKFIGQSIASKHNSSGSLKAASKHFVQASLHGRKSGQKAVLDALLLLYSTSAPLPAIHHLVINSFSIYSFSLFGKLATISLNLYVVEKVAGAMPCHAARAVRSRCVVVSSSRSMSRTTATTFVHFKLTHQATFTLLKYWCYFFL